ncbi:CsgG/HfaB family protein [Profundibacterium mesophilum]|uniref:Curli production assemblytransport outer membrane lipoprotein component CsgG n=1 Tax=Profundibacterium mesophilum KAUST100406-0324 TaxID=1037889 RepID=A0A921TF31_9RHOB|nr:CsgG/HfaB family protein [Profundibacterium mesophilum]KAF0676064.1 Curli production assemblytransport outer membrane lipoprotein component CsgG [Profundibacterium mesophilum KAUST100406-0324]
MPIERPRPGFRRRFAAAVGLMLLAGCAQLDKPLIGPYPASVSRITEQNYALRLLPAPKSRITVGVYDFPDLTGQYREAENFQTLSRAVTQGGAPLLIEALQDAGEGRWFSVLDRSDLDSMLRERQIATEMRRLYRGETLPDPNAIRPLRHAGILIQGGIVGYDSNLQTGGFGARYLGIGGDTKWKLDVVTVSLRAVSSGSGEVLASVMIEKPIASTSLRGGVFRYIALDELLEIESGVAVNESKQLAVRMAVDKAVYSLILSGAERGIWSFSDPARGRTLVDGFRAERYRGTDLKRRGLTVRPPDTLDAARVVETRPRRAQATTVRRVSSPAQSRTPARETVPVPPPADPGEVISRAAGAPI